MNRRSTLAGVCLLTLALTACATPRAQHPSDAGARGEALFPGGRYWRESRTEPAAMQVHVLELDLRRVRLELTAGDTSGGREHVAQTTSDYARRNGLAAAVNASYFTPFKGGSKGGEDYYPHAGDGADVSGAAIAFGQVVSPVEPDEDERVNAIVCIRAAAVTIRDGQDCGEPVDHAVSAGPRLLADGQARSFEAFGQAYGENRHPRSALGLDDDAPRAWLVVVDGRQAGYSEGASLAELIAIFRALGAEQAINLDGGGSSTLAARRYGEVVVLNSPIHTGVPGRERPSANHIGVRVRP
ncbi:MAG: hypothetical protein A2882_15115 [Phenylobacterium sp. RIFCSPHIGHO2_01_FULL_70_10]|nr:MAG: hypothetical protein A2882_15115 [Phenylobacterium sp. RIFCSPHIGHO2_01_FULL_70_10]